MRYSLNSLNLFFAAVLALCTPVQNQNRLISSRYDVYDAWVAQQIRPLLSSLPGVVLSSQELQHCTDDPLNSKTDNTSERSTLLHGKIISSRPVGINERGELRFEMQVWYAGRVYCVDDKEFAPSRALNVLIELGRQDGVSGEGEADAYYFFASDSRYLGFRNIDPVSGELSSYFYLFESGQLSRNERTLRLCATSLLSSTSEPPPDTFWNCQRMSEKNPDFRKLVFNPYYRELDSILKENNLDLPGVRFFEDSEDRGRILARLTIGTNVNGKD